MAVIHISEADAARDFVGLMAQVRAGAEIVIESGSHTVAVLHAPAPPRRSIEECIALLPAESQAVIDEDCARDARQALFGSAERASVKTWPSPS